MAEFDLVLKTEDGVGERYRIPPQGLTIGRSPENQVMVNDRRASRRHARLSYEGDRIAVEDLGSRNGIDINGQRVQRGVMSEGDVLRIGGTVFNLIQSGGSNLGQSIIDPDAANQVYRSILNEGNTGGNRYPVLYQAAMLLGSVFDLDELLEKILALIFEALPARRGFVLTVEDGAGDPQIRASRTLEDGQEGPPLSRTLINYVFEHEGGMLTTDAQDDSRFDSSESIFCHGIHSAMCTALRGRESLVGAIYIDSGVSHEPFNKDQLELLTAIAQVVGVAVENARLYQQSVHQAHLAAIGEATAGLGHCVKNILTGLRGGAQFVDRAIEQGDVTYLEKGWPIMSRAVNRIENMVMDMLMYSRDQAPERCVTDLNQIIQECVEHTRVRAEELGVAVEFEASSTGAIKADPKQMYRVVQNLLNNAVEACHESKGTVRVACSYSDEGCTIQVSDTGVGIPEEILHRLPRAFLTTKGSTGTGLGLACSYKLVEDHGGAIDVVSQVGQGAEFTVFLPRQEQTTRPTQMIRIPGKE